MDPISKLRLAVALVHREQSRLLALHGPGAAADGLRSAWAQLINLLALGPEPVTQVCPACNKTVRRAATLCPYCWTRLDPAGSFSGREDEKRQLPS